MIISCFVNTFNSNLLEKYNINSSLFWIDLANWLPFFWCFGAFKPYLDNSEKRKLAGLIILSGTFPILLTGICQTFFGWYGPFQFLNGFITWYQRPLEGITGLTGLFSNPNYAGNWLNLVMPFCFASLINSKKNTWEISIIYFFIFLIGLCTVLTNSRSAWLGIFIAVILMYGKKSFKFIRNSLFLILSSIFLTISPIFGIRVQSFFRSIIPDSIWMEFTNFQSSRLEIWTSGLNLFFNNPIFGSGSGSFTQIFKYETGLWKGHSHNLVLEFLISYGIIAGIFIFIPIIILIYYSSKKIFLMKFSSNKIVNIYDKAWLSSLFILIFSQMVDVQYFDGRISIFGWLILSGLSNLIDDKVSYKNFQN